MNVCVGVPVQRLCGLACVCPCACVCVCVYVLVYVSVSAFAHMYVDGKMSKACMRLSACVRHTEYISSLYGFADCFHSFRGADAGINIQGCR